MTMFRRRLTGAYPLAESDIRALHPNTSYPAILTAEHYDALGVDVVFPTPQPENNDPTKAIRELPPVQVGATWEQAWEIADAFSGEDKAEKEAEAIAASTAAKAAMLKLAIANAVQATLDAEAQTHQYDSILSACTYVNSAIPQYHNEGSACAAWRDAVWAKVAALGGEMPVAEVLKELPVMTWPQ